ncbi:MAG: GIY-YIG nuclease family protein [Kiritimatiellia bacterium]
MSWFIYIIRSKLTGRYYRGCCEDFEKRLTEHNSGKTRSTKAYHPWVKIYIETFENKTDALKREKYFKTRSGYRCLKQMGVT